MISHTLFFAPATVRIVLARTPFVQSVAILAKGLCIRNPPTHNLPPTHARWLSWWAYYYYANARYHSAILLCLVLDSRSHASSFAQQGAGGAKQSDTGEHCSHVICSVFRAVICHSTCASFSAASNIACYNFHILYDAHIL